MEYLIIFVIAFLIMILLSNATNNTNKLDNEEMSNYLNTLEDDKKYYSAMISQLNNELTDIEQEFLKKKTYHQTYFDNVLDSLTKEHNRDKMYLINKIKDFEAEQTLLLKQIDEVSKNEQ